MVRPEAARIETEAPVSGQNFISDLRQINEAMRQFDGSGAQSSVHAGVSNSAAHSQAAHGASQTAGFSPSPVAMPAQNLASALASPVASTLSASPAKTAAILAEVREKLNLSSDAEAMNALVAIGYRSLKPLLG